MASNYIPSNIRVDLESENGLLGKKCKVALQHRKMITAFNLKNVQ